MFKPVVRDNTKKKDNPMYEDNPRIEILDNDSPAVVSKVSADKNTCQKSLVPR